MKDNYINVIFVIDESGSMYSSKEDVVGGFMKVVDEQRQIKEGKCTISLYTFADDVKEIFVGKDVSDINSIDYNPCGCTAMNDGIGIAITNIGKWLNNMKEDEKPSKNLVVIMTDGMENSSKEYTLQQVKEMIKHQTEKYNWEFMYIGADITTSKMADDLGISNKMFSSKKDYCMAWDSLSSINTAYRRASMGNAGLELKKTITLESSAITSNYENELGFKIN